MVPPFSPPLHEKFYQRAAEEEALKNPLLGQESTPVFPQRFF